MLSWSADISLQLILAPSIFLSTYFLSGFARFQAPSFGVPSGYLFYKRVWFPDACHLSRRGLLLDILGAHRQSLSGVLSAALGPYLLQNSGDHRRNGWIGELLSFLSCNERLAGEILLSGCFPSSAPWESWAWWLDWLGCSAVGAFLLLAFSVTELY